MQVFSQLHSLEVLRPFFGVDTFGRTKDKVFDVIVIFRHGSILALAPYFGHVVTCKLEALRTWGSGCSCHEEER